MKKILTLLFSVLTLSSFSQSIPSYVPASGLVGWWPFTGNTNDSSGNGYDGANHGAALTNDRFGNANAAYDFDGASAYIEIANNPVFNLTTGASFSVWFNTNNPSSSQRIIDKATVNTSNSWLVDIGAKNNRARYIPPGVTVPASIPYSDSPFTAAGIWVHLVVTYNGHVVKFYKNGVLDDTLSTTGTSSTNTNPVRIGANSLLSLNFFNGKIDDIGVWNRALSQCEISNLYYSSYSTDITNPSDVTIASGATATFSVTDTSISTTYRWQQDSGTGFLNLSDGGAYSGVTTKTLTISPVTPIMDNYLYRCTRSGGSCGNDTTSAAILTINTAGISNVSSSNKITTFPNPAKDYVSIRSDATIRKVEIVNIVGQQVFSQEYNANAVQVNLAALQAGLYFIRINEHFVQKLIKE